jgi:NAD(P)-dependent dehydrogenase (short-subunit alcohol dehydrogenase family)
VTTSAAGYGLLTGRRAVVTGGARGIGEAIAHRFAIEGADVAIVDIDADGAASAASRISAETGVATVGLGVDVADPVSVRAAADQIEDALGLCDVIVPNAGILVLKSALDITDSEFARVMDVNLNGAFTTSTEFARRLKAAGKSGSVVFSASLFALRGGAGNAAYSASKFGMVGLAQSMAADLATAGIRVNTVCPGQIDTEMLRQLFVDRAAQSGRTPREEQTAFEERIPFKRLGQVSEVADIYVFLASALSGYVTGQSIVVDGGWMVS